ncbi:hypothetical protein BV22DRAFT_1123893 [Leucogyrophana mollusca]|uniref:Uncharacterized protein n=1 Tax=Leucogyrophana mollusca TaxID=85980 RepID=A0ACB8AXG3_9AGAM|nr:hypothetical protein BV22DRAFT_1123893 [Leucogyrophana mollusca]
MGGALVSALALGAFSRFDPKPVIGPMLPGAFVAAILFGYATTQACISFSIHTYAPQRFPHVQAVASCIRTTFPAGRDRVVIESLHQPRTVIPSSLKPLNPFPTNLEATLVSFLVRVVYRPRARKIHTSKSSSSSSPLALPAFGIIDARFGTGIAHSLKSQYHTASVTPYGVTTVASAQFTETGVVTKYTPQFQITLAIATQILHTKSANIAGLAPVSVALGSRPSGHADTKTPQLVLDHAAELRGHKTRVHTLSRCPNAPFAEMRLVASKPFLRPKNRLNSPNGVYECVAGCVGSRPPPAVLERCRTSGPRHLEVDSLRSTAAIIHRNDKTVQDTSHSATWQESTTSSMRGHRCRWEKANRSACSVAVAAPKSKCTPETERGAMPVHPAW